MTISTPMVRRRQTAKRMRELIAEREKTRGLLVAFEGPDGSGKTTQRKLFQGWLKSEGVPVQTAKWNSSPLVKPLVRARKAARSLSPREFSLIHAADFRYRVETEVIPALWSGTTVVADRHFFTALTRDATRGLELDWLLHLYSPLLWPDVVFYFSVSPETSGKRIAAERQPTYYEAGQDMTEIADPQQSYTKFIGNVIQQYDSLAKIFQFVVVDAEQSIYHQHRLIRELFQSGQRRPWGQWNQDVLMDWLSQNPKLLDE